MQAPPLGVLIAEPGYVYPVVHRGTLHCAVALGWSQWAGDDLRSDDQTRSCVYHVRVVLPPEPSFCSLVCFTSSHWYISTLVFIHAPVTFISKSEPPVHAGKLVKAQPCRKISAFLSVGSGSVQPKGCAADSALATTSCCVT